MKSIVAIVLVLLTILGSASLGYVAVTNGRDLVKPWFPDYEPEDVAYSQLRNQSIAALNRLNHLHRAKAPADEIEAARREWDNIIVEMHLLRIEINRRYGRLAINVR